MLVAGARLEMMMGEEVEAEEVVVGLPCSLFVDFYLTRHAYDPSSPAYISMTLISGPPLLNGLAATAYPLQTWITTVEHHTTRQHIISSGEDGGGGKVRIGKRGWKRGTHS